MAGIWGNQGLGEDGTWGLGFWMLAPLWGVAMSAGGYVPFAPGQLETICKCLPGSLSHHRKAHSLPLPHREPSQKQAQHLLCPQTGVFMAHGRLESQELG